MVNITKKGGRSDGKPNRKRIDSFLNQRKEFEIMKKTKKLIALLLSFIMIICSFPMTAFAESLESLGELQADESVEATNEESTENEQKWYVIDKQEIISDQVIGNVVEVTSLREENVKHFRLSDGTYEAIVYAEPVHRKDKDGVWQEIDNTIELQNYRGLAKYETQDLRISFASSFRANSEIFTLNENGYSVSMSLLSNGIEDDVISASPTELSPIPIVNNSSSVRNTTKFDSLEEAKNIDNRASIVYNNIRENTNIEYVLRGNDVKENIIITAPCEEYEYVFQLNLSGLSAIMTENGEVLLKDADTDEIKYVIPAPYMYDANGVYSYDVSYTLEQVKDEIYLLAVTADSEWINSTDRAFPVVIDPTISYRGVCYDSYVDANFPNTNFGQNSVMWVTNSCAAFIKIDMPNLPEGSTISIAYLNVPYYYNITSGSMMATAHQITENWSESNITFNNYPDVSTSTLDMVSMPAGSNITASSPGTAKFKITDLFKSWYNGTPNYGVMIMRRPSAMGENLSVLLKARESSTECAYLSISYSYYLPDGVYAFENVGMDNSWIKLSNNGINDYMAGNRLKYEGSSVDPSDPEIFDRTRLFKITRIGNTTRYTIRSMIDNNISFNIVDGKVIATDIPSVDSQVAVSDTFNIEGNGYGFTISPCNSSYVLSMYDLSVNNISYEAKSNASLYAAWDLKQYTGAEAKGYELLSNAYPFMVGETATFRAAVWSTEAGCNYPNLSVKSEYSSKISFQWDSNNRSAAVEFLNPGQITISCKIYDQNMNEYYGWSARYNIQQIRDGECFIKNAALNKYIQIEKDAESYYLSGNTIEAWDFDGEEYQKWEISYISDGYYKIVSVQSNMALTVPSNHVNGEGQLIQEYYHGYNRQLWKIVRSSSSRYVLIPKSNETYNSNWCVSVVSQSSENTDSFNVQQGLYSDDSNYSDEWYLEFIWDSAFIALPEEYDRSSFFSTAIDYLENIGYINNFDNHTTVSYGMSQNDFLNYMRHSKITVVRTHGSKTSISLTGDSLTRTELLALPADTLEYSELIIYGACETAKGGENDANLVTATVSAGARTVIGFENPVYAYGCNRWCLKFFEYYALYYNDESKTIYDVCYDTDLYMKSDIYYQGVSDDGSLISLANFVIAGEQTFPQ